MRVLKRPCPEVTSDPVRTTIKVAIIEDRREIREGLSTLIQFTDGFSSVGQFYSMEEALMKMGAHLPDVVLIDIGLPGMSGIEGIEILRARYPQLLMLVLTVYDDDERIFRAICAGASGYLSKKTPPSRLLEGIRETFAGGSPMSPEVARRVIDLFRRIAPPKNVAYHSDRARNTIAETACRGTQLQKPGGETQCQRQHHLVSHAPRL